MCQTLAAGAQSGKSPRLASIPAHRLGAARGFQGSTEPSLGAGVGVHEGLPTSLVSPGACVRSLHQVQGCVPSVY